MDMTRNGMRKVVEEEAEKEVKGSILGLRSGSGADDEYGIDGVCCLFSLSLASLKVEKCRYMDLSSGSS